MSTEKGISIIEIIFAIGVTVLVISGTVSLIVKSTSLKTSSLQRKNASDVAQLVVENLVSQKNNNEIIFWELDTITGQTIPQFEGYKYNIGFSQVETGTCSDIGNTPTCVNAIISISWGDNEKLTVKRFFSKFY